MLAEPPRSIVISISSNSTASATLSFAAQSTTSEVFGETVCVVVYEVSRERRIGSH